MESMSDALSRQFDPAAAANVKRLPVQSAMPGTTLQLIPLKAFQTGGNLIGTLSASVSLKWQDRRLGSSLS